MSSRLHDTLAIREILSKAMGELKVKNFFSYYAIYKDDAMFGLYKDGNFFIRISPAAKNHTSWVCSLPRLEDCTVGIHNKNFYYLPDGIVPRTELYIHLLNETISEIKHEKQEAMLYRQQLIRSLPNLNIHIEHLLRRLNIHSVEELSQKGAINTFVELIRLGVNVDKMLLFKLYTALNRRYVYTLSDAEKVQILNEANEALYNAGLRQRFATD